MDQENAKQASPVGPNPDYNPPDVAGKMQWREGPMHYYSTEAALLGFVNRLEEENHHSKWFIQDAQGSQDRMMSDVRKRNTDLEVENRNLRLMADAMRSSVGELDAYKTLVASYAKEERETRQRIQELELAVDQLGHERESLQHDLEERARMLAGANERVRNLVASVNVANKVEHIFRHPNGHDVAIQEIIDEVDRWQNDTFGNAAGLKDNALALIQEAIEVGQIFGVTADDILLETARVLNRPMGATQQEMGGVLVTWAGMMARIKFKGADVALGAIKDCWDRQDEIRRKKGYAASVGVGKMVPGALEKLAAAGIKVHHTHPAAIHTAQAMPLRPNIPTGSPFRDRPVSFVGQTDPVPTSGRPVHGDFHKTVLDERQPYQFDPFKVAEAQGKVDLEAHLTATRAQGEG